MRNGSLKIISVAGVDIYVHWSWLIIFALLTWSLGAGFYPAHFPFWSTATDYIVAAISAILLFFTVLLHELSHTFVARARGLPVTSITLFIFGGVSNLSREPRTPQTELMVAIAGPLMSLLLAGISYVIYLLTLYSAPSQVYAVFGYLALVNLLLALFNMIPGYPLDGGRVLHSLLWMWLGNLRRATRIASTIGDWIGWLFIAGGLFEAFFAGNVLGGIWLAFIGWFLHNAATASYQRMVLDQTLRGVDVRDVMDPPPPPASPNSSVADLAYDTMLGRSQRLVPIQSPNGNLLGIVTLADVQHVARDDWSATPVSQIMQPMAQLHTVQPDQALADAVDKLASDGYNQLPVVENGRLVGVLNRAHVLSYIHLREQLGPKGASEAPARETTRRAS